MGKDDRQEQIRRLAGKVMSLCRDSILVHLRFLDGALAGLRTAPGGRAFAGADVTPSGNAFASAGAAPGGGMASDGAVLYYDPVWVLRRYQENPVYVTRCYLHALLHCIFHHSFQYGKLEAGLWDLAADVAVEGVILELGFSAWTLQEDADALRSLEGLKEDAGALTADRLYRYFRQNPLTPNRREELTRLFQKDLHTLWKPREELLVTQEQWKKVSERVRAELKSFTKTRRGSESLEKNLEEAVKDHYDYGALLRKFTVISEDITLNEEEFDYIYYHYGLEHYGNLPLVEPLEYREVSKVREFVIAIDTSASCRGALVKAFLNKTYSILKSTENFFTRVNVHIIQCDSGVQSDTKITSRDEFESFLQYGKLKGFAGTDFRPVFAYVQQLQEQKEFENLKGLIYFTDGYGIYPEKMPDYDVIFAFLEEDENRAPVPPWSMKVILEAEELERESMQQEITEQEGTPHEH